MKRLHICIVLCIVLARMGTGDTFTVINNNDSGAGSLRQALLDANGAAGHDIIAFSLPADGLSITPLFALPDVTDPVTLDGTTQPGWSNAPLVELSGFRAASSDGLRLMADGCVVRGLVINRFSGDGIEINGCRSNHVEGCYIGLDTTGTIDRGNTREGVYLLDAADNLIGGEESAARNLISGNNQNGVHISGASATGNQILGNLIGLGVDDTDVGNSYDGIRISAPDNVIGGSTDGTRNVISGNNSDGIELNGATASGNRIEGNYLGVDSTGASKCSNTANGILLTSAAGNVIGGTVAGAGNLISGNNSDGIEMSGSGVSSNVVAGNLIGVDATGQAGVGNKYHGVYLASYARDNRVGGVAAGETNVIAFNGADGVYIYFGTASGYPYNNAVRANAILGNTGLGIDLGANGVAANDTGDADNGPNRMQNYPVLAAATNTPAGLFVAGQLNSLPSGAYDLDFFSSQAGDASGNGEGELFLGSTSVTTAADGNAAFAVTLPQSAHDRYITATATDAAGNTSEFSRWVLAETTVPPLTVTVINANDAGPGSLRAAIELVNDHWGQGPDTIFLDPPAGDRRLMLLTPLPPITGDILITPAPRGIATLDASTGDEVLWIDGSCLLNGPYADEALLQLTDGQHSANHLGFGGCGEHAVYLHSSHGSSLNHLAFGDVGADSRVNGDAIHVAGDSGEFEITDCDFVYVTGHAVSDLDTTVHGKIKICNNRYGNIFDTWIERKYGGPYMPTTYLDCAAPDGTSSASLSWFGTANTVVDVEMHAVEVGWPLPDFFSQPSVLGFEGSLVSMQSASTDWFGQLTVDINIPTEPFLRNWGVTATVTSDGDTSAFSKIGLPPWECLDMDNLLSQANFTSEGVSGCPVSTFTGELFDSLPPDLNLGGPMPLLFQRYYAAFLSLDGNGQGTLGTNWLHNFELTLQRTDDQVRVVTELGRVLTFTNTPAGWTQLGRQDTPYQLAVTATNCVMGDPHSQRVFTFDTDGRLTAIADGRGNTHTLGYENGHLATVADGLGRTLTFRYDPQGSLTNVSDGVRAAGFTQINGLLATARDLLGRLTSYAYTHVTSAVGDLPALMTSTTRPEGNSPYSQTFNDWGQVATQTDADQNTTTFTYQGAVTTIADPRSCSRTHYHSGDGELLAFEDEEGEVIQLGYTPQGRREGVFSQTGHLTTLGYDAASGKPSAVTNADGTTVLFAYTNRVFQGMTFRDLASVTYPDGTSVRFTYDAAGNVTAFTDQAGQSWHASHNARGQRLNSTNPDGGVVTFTYDARGNLASRRDSDTGITLYAYDTLNCLTNIVHPDGSSLSLTYDASGRMLSVRDERDHVTGFAYDRNGNLTEVTDADGQTTHYAYDGMDRLVQVTDRLGHSRGLEYDPFGQIATFTSRNGLVTRFDYDTRRRLVTIRDPGNQFWGRDYDNEGLLTSAWNPLNQVTQRSLDALGYEVERTNPLGQTEAFVRDPMRRVTGHVDPLGRTRSYSYDARGSLSGAAEPGIGAVAYEHNSLGGMHRLTGLNGEQWNFGYSPMGRLTSLTDPLSRSSLFVYDARGRLAATLFPDGTTRTNRFDAAGNLIGRQDSAGPDLTFTYDALNRLTQTEELTLAYDVENRVTNTISDGITYGAAYDPDGRLTSVTYHNGALTVTYTYDNLDRLTSVEDSLSGTSIGFSYDNAGRLTAMQRYYGIDATFTYDGAGRLTRIQDGDALDLLYTLDAAGQVTQCDLTAPLDPAGLVGESVQEWSHDAAHQITNPGYTYDARGRLIASPDRSLTWDGASRLTGINAVTLSYNGLGQIISRAAGGSTIRYHYNHAIRLAPIMAEQNVGSGQVLRYYVWTPRGRLLYMIDTTLGNAVRYYHFDRMGSTLALTDPDGNVTDAYAYTPYGELLGHTGTSPQPFTYIGAYGVRAEPETGLYHMRARYYDPVTARFLSRDVAWPRIGNPGSLNSYEYALNSPTTYRDVLGRSEQEATELDSVAEVLFLMEPDESSYARAVAKENDRVLREGGRWLGTSAILNSLGKDRYRIEPTGEITILPPLVFIDFSEMEDGYARSVAKEKDRVLREGGRWPFENSILQSLPEDRYRIEPTGEITILPPLDELTTLSPKPAWFLAEVFDTAPAEKAKYRTAPETQRETEAKDMAFPTRERGNPASIKDTHFGAWH